jgi:hypothetical protein
MINDKYNFQLQPGIVKLKEMKSLGPKRTQIEIIPNRSSNPGNLMPAITETVFTYDRLNCTEFFRNTVAVNISGLKLPITTFDILKQIGDRNQIVFETDDFVHQTFDHYNAPAEPDFIIQADSHSLRFVGHLKVRLVNTTKFNLSSITDVILEFPEVTQKHNPAIKCGDFVFGRYDFTNWRELLKDTPTGLYHNPGLIAKAINACTGIRMSIGPQPYTESLVHTLVDDEPHCKVLYHGAPTSLWTARQDCNRVLVIELNPAYSTGMDGYIRLHYD